MGFTGFLTLLFIGLKLTDFIDWSWWLVLLPTLINIVLCVAVATYLTFKE